MAKDSSGLEVIKHMSSIPSSLDKIIEGKRRLLLDEAETFSKLADHQGEKGRLNESHLVKCLRDFLPSKMGLGTGFIENSKGRKSCQQDIIIFDALNNIPLYSSDSWAVYTIEMVYGVIEVKTTLDKKQIEKCFLAQGQKNKKDKANTKSFQYMAEKEGKYYLKYVNELGQAKYKTEKSPLPPRFFIFAYDTTYKDIHSLEKILCELAIAYDIHFHGICILKNNWFITRNDEPRELCECTISKKAGFKIFLNNLWPACESMDVSMGDRLRYTDEFLKELYRAKPL